MFQRVTGYAPRRIDITISTSPSTRSLLVTYDAWRYTDTHVAEILVEHLHLTPGQTCALAARMRAAHAARSAEPVATWQLPAWQVLSDSPGRLRAGHPYIRRYSRVAACLDAMLFGLGGVTSYSVNVSTANVLVRYDPSFLPRDELLDALDTTLRTLVREAVGAGVAPALDRATLRLALSSMALSLASASYAVPVLGTFALAGTLVAAAHILGSALRSLLGERKLRVDVLDATVISLAIAFRKAFPAAFMVWVVDLSNMLLDASHKASRRRLADIFGRQTRKALRLGDGGEEECPISTLRPGDIVVVRSGEQIPVDGVVSAGQAMIDQSSLTGEHAPVERMVDENVFATTTVLGGKLHVRAVCTGEGTNAARMVRLIEQSLEYKVHIQTQTERFADMMVLPTLGLGGVGYLTSGVESMMAVINADFGTGIRIAGPLALLESISIAARNSILIKKGAVLESLCKLDAVVFDKTGTLTENVLMVERVICLSSSFDEARVLGHAAHAERRFAHPIARAILRRADELGIAIPQTTESSLSLGYGVQSQLDGETVNVGSRRFMEQKEIAFTPTASAELLRIHARGGVAVCVAVSGHMVGLIELSNQPRSEALQIIEYLREQRGIEELHLVSGDHELPTRALAEQLRIDRYRAEVLPQDKALYVRALQDRGLKVAMVGDGVNDVVGLTQADCSISLRGAADAAVDAADVVFLDGNLRRFQLLFEISEGLTSNVERSFLLVLIPNSFCVAGALFGVFGLGASLVFNNVFNLLATLNGMRAQDALKRQQGIRR
jgi:heavy metal translocating P-type ATPase